MSSYNFDNNVLNTFVNGQIVSADDAIYGLNPKMVMIADAINDHATSIDTLVGQVGSLGGLVYNVTVYGADPTGVTDSTVAIQNAINDAVTNKGIVVFSNGIYKVTDELVVAGNCYITSDGSGQGVVVFQNTSSKGIFNITDSYVRITDLKLDIRSASVGVTSVITAQHPTLTSLVSVFVQRCQFYSTTSTTINAVYFRKVVSGAVANCTISGTSTSKGIQLVDSSNTLVSQNSFSAVAQAVSLNYGATASVTSNSNIIIEQNTLNGLSTDMLSINYATCVYVDNNVFSQLTGTSTAYSFITIANCVQVAVTDNRFDHTLSATTYYHRGISLSSTLYPLISGNTFYSGSYPVYVSASTSYLQVLSNMMLEPRETAVYASGALKSALIADNTFLDVWSNSSSTPSAITVTGGDRVSILGNSLVRGSKSAAFVNAYGVYFPAAPVPVLLSGNDFTIATTPVSVSGNVMYDVDPTGVKIYYGTAAPVSGTYVRGSKVMNTTPTASGYVGWVCVTAGTPGTWKGFGLIQA